MYLKKDNTDNQLIQKMRRQKFVRHLLAQICSTGLAASLVVHAQYPEWDIHDDLQIPNEGNQQTASLILDIDQDGIDDFVITERTQSPSVVWYRYSGKTWERRIIDNTPLTIEAGGTYLDIDRDGDPDIVFGGDARSNQIWWWENPCPQYGGEWKRHLIKDHGRNKHHDQLFGDFDHDGQAELVSWNQHDSLLLMFEIPVDPHSSGTWEYAAIYREEPRDEGLAAADIDLDGKLDIVGAGKWFEHQEGVTFTSHLIDAAMNFSRAASGQLVAGGHPEVVFCPGDADGDAQWYEWKKGRWISHSLGHVVHGHTLQVADLNRDGKQDIFIGEMGNPGDGDNADLMVWYGDGKGHFRKMIIRTGQGIHEGRIGDMNGDHVLDILVKPYNHHSPGVEVMTGRLNSKLPLDLWRTHKVEDLPERAMFITAADINLDGDKDIVLGGYWYENPGSADGRWHLHEVGRPLKNMAAVGDFDRDGDTDILGTRGVGSEANHDFVWAENENGDHFTIHDNINYTGEGDFLQGCIIIQADQQRLVILSWHSGESCTMALVMPEDPAVEQWETRLIFNFTLKEEVSAGDIDRDGDQDLLLGTCWLEKTGSGWTLNELGEVATEGSEPDRNNLADVDGDGRLDALVVLELGTDAYWFRPPADPRNPWQRNTIGVIDGQGFSMDMADFDLDMDPDMVVGEHRGPQFNRVIILENEGRKEDWKMIEVDRRPNDVMDNHDGTVAVDIDGDGDLDIISIGWYNPKLWIFENLAVN
jgi:hypothetical protein